MTVENLSGVKRKIGVALPPEAVRAEFDQAFRGLQQHARIKGFRPGKVPRTILERVYGEQVRNEVIGKLIQESYARALEQHHLHAVARPEIVAEEIRPGEGLRYSATIEVKPTFDVAGYEDIEVERSVEGVSDEQVQAQLERLRESYAQMVRLEDRDVVEQGDLVEIAYTGVMEGRALAGASAQARVIEIGSGTFPPPFEEQLVGKRVGESAHIGVPYPAQHHSGEIAGKTVTFRVEIKAVGRKDLLALDDEFAKDHGECGSLAELREKIRGGLEAAAARDADERVRTAVLEKLIAKNPIEVPDALVERRLDIMLREVGAHGVDARGNPEIEKRLDELRSELRRRARDAVHSGLLLERLAAQQGLEVADADVEARIADVLHAAPRDRERLADLYRGPEARRELHDRLAQEKALAWLAGRVAVREVPHQT